MNLDIEFSSHSTAITGETGAGKSISIDALGLCLGDRAESTMVRRGAEKAEVTATFQLPKTPAQQIGCKVRNWTMKNIFA